MITTFGELLRRKRKDIPLQQAELAKKVGVTASYVSLLESGKRPPPSDEVTRSIERALGLAENELVKLAHVQRTPEDIRKTMDLEETYLKGIPHKPARAVEPGVPVIHDLRSIPLINKVAAGYQGHFTDKGYPVGIADEYVSIPDLDDPNAFAVTVVGDSMEPRLREGDVLVISPREMVGNGDICFVRIDDNGDSSSTIKQVWRDDETSIRLESFNPKYASRIIPREKIGGVFRAVRRLEKL